MLLAAYFIVSNVCGVRDDRGNQTDRELVTLPGIFWLVLRDGQERGTGLE